MAYNIFDVLDKQIDFKKQIILNFEDTLQNEYREERVRTILKILKNEIAKQIIDFENKKKNLKQNYLEEELEVNFLAYDKFSKDFIGFKNTFHEKNYSNIKGVFEYLVALEQKNYSILIGLKDKMYALDKKCGKEVHLEIDKILDEAIIRINGLKKFVL